MDAQSLFNVMFAVCGFLGGFIIKAMWDAIRSLQKDISDTQSSIAANYVRRDDFRDHAKRLEDMLMRIESKLDGKVDKP